MNHQLHQLCKDVKAKDLRALARLLTKIEDLGGGVLENECLLRPPQTSFRVGLTGPPGAGKSTLMNELIRSFRSQNWSVGVLAVDPSSYLSQGAILGDRIRYSEHFLDKGVFIRSLGTRGSLGGLNASTYLMLRAYDLFSFDVVFIETVGVGQTELEIVHVADKTGMVLVPESGDSIQIMKAGLLEVVDFYVVNKSDRQGAGALANELRMQHNGESAPSVFQTVATKGKGIQPIVEFLEPSQKKDRHSPKKLIEEAQALLRAKYAKDLFYKVSHIKNLEDFKDLILQDY